MVLLAKNSCFLRYRVSSHPVVPPGSKARCEGSLLCGDTELHRARLCRSPVRTRDPVPEGQVTLWCLQESVLHVLLHRPSHVWFIAFLPLTLKTSTRLIEFSWCHSCFFSLLLFREEIQGKSSIIRNSYRSHLHTCRQVRTFSVLRIFSLSRT